MSNDRTQLVFIIDRSGSMSGLERDTVGGFNSVLEENKKLTGACRVTTILFDTRFEILHDCIPVENVPAMTMNDYRPGGCTALLDAMGEGINRLLWQKEDFGRAQFVIITDGEENSSREYTRDQIRAMVERMKKERGWDFLFLGANMDAISAARSVGISADRAVEALSDAEGTEAQYRSVAMGNRQFRCSAPMEAMDESWKECVQADRRRRRKNSDQ